MKNKHFSLSQMWKRSLSMVIAGTMAFSTLPTFPLTVSAANTEMPTITKAGSIPAASDTFTYGQPFAKGTAGSENFRIPVLLTLENGDLLSAADARWETLEDGGGIDSIASVSSDGGKTWNYSFPLFFPDSSGYAGRDATTIIDPAVVEGPDGTIYFIADVNPTGSTTMYKRMGTGTGYVTVNGKRYLALTDNYNNVNTEPSDTDLTAYAYYVDDFDKNGYAQILRRADGTPTGYGVDEWYNLYTVENGQYVDNLRQSQVNAATQIQQNAYYKDSLFHVYSIDYIWVIASTDHGRTWEHPKNINDEIKRHEKENGILVSPGQGITTDAGDIIIGFYNTQDGEENASYVYSSDNGETWKRTADIPGAGNGGRWSSENEIVELEDGTLRMFYRNGTGYVCYADAVKNSSGEYSITNNVLTEFEARSGANGCNVTAIGYSKKINGKQAILFASPNTPRRRANGVIHVFLVNDDAEHTMTLAGTFDVPDSGDAFAYSCITELEDGSIGLLWESVDMDIRFDRYSILDICPGADITGAVVDVKLGKGKTYTRAYAGKSSVTQQPDSSIATVSASGEGVTITGVKDGFTRTVVDDVMYRIHVTDSSTSITLNEGDSHVFPGGTLTQAPSDPDVISVEEYNESIVGMYDHVSSTFSSLDSFSSEMNSGISLSDAEFTFTGSGTTWQIKNAKTNTYLTNAAHAGAFFSSSAANMTVSPMEGEDTFRICKADGSRYVIFYFNEMNFNSNSAYDAGFLDGSYELVLLEKQAGTSENDVIPGYTRASSITDGHQYLISYIWEDGSVIVLYPTNGQDNQTKLAYRANKGIRVTEAAPGTSTVTIGDTAYTFTVTDKNCSHASTVIKEALEADCYLDGYTGDKVCVDCGYVVEQGAVIPALDHHWDEGVVTKEVTVTENGEKVYTCTHDSFHTKTEVIYASAYSRFLDKYTEAANRMDNYGLYTPESSAALKEAFETGTQIEESKGASRSAMYRNAAALQDAMSALVKKSSNVLHFELGIALTKAEADRNSRNGIPDDVWNAFVTAYDTAIQMPSDASADEIWVLLNNLTKAQNSLDAAKVEVTRQARVTASTALAEAVKAADAIYTAGKSDYTPDSWQAFVDAYNAAKNPQADADAATLQSLTNALKTAQSKLAIHGIVPIPSPDTGIRADDTVTYNHMQFQVLNAAKKTAALVKNENKSRTKAAIPAAVTINGVSCKVTQIRAKAFKGCSRLKQVVIGKNVAAIGKQAFLNCRKLSKISVKGTALKSIKNGALKNTAAKVTVTVPKKLGKVKRTVLFKKMTKAGMAKKSVIR